MRIPAKDWFLRARPFLVFPPLQAALLLWALPAGSMGSPASAAFLIVAGLFAWSLVEWVFHRGMHLGTNNGAITRFQEYAHMRHHHEPHDVERSIVKLAGSVPMAIVFLSLAVLLLPGFAAAALFHTGMVLGYLAYEMVHLATHARWRFPILDYLTAYHRRHHFGNPKSAYGVTSPLWDWVFGTLPSAGVRPPGVGSSFEEAAVG